MGVGRLICWAKNVGLSPLGSRKGCNAITTPQPGEGHQLEIVSTLGPQQVQVSSVTLSRLGQQRREEAGGRPRPSSSQACLLQLFNALNAPREPHHRLPGSPGVKECQERQPVSKAGLLHKSTLPLGEKIIT